MTKAQEKAIERIKALVKKDFREDFYEIKEWRVDENEYFISLVLEIGGIGDEGTMAEIFARNRAQLFIGPRGGITYPMFKRNWKGKGPHSYTKTFRGYSILQAVCDQR